MRTLAIATIFLTLVIPFALDELSSTAGAWTLEAAGLIWIGFRQQRGLPRLLGYVCSASPAWRCARHQRHGVPTQVFNAYLFNGLMAAAASLAGAFFVHRAGRAGALKRGEEACETLLIASATVWLVVTTTIEIDAFVPMRLALAVALAAASAVACCRGCSAADSTDGESRGPRGNAAARLRAA